MKKRKHFNFKFKMRIMSIIFIFAILSCCLIVYLKTYSEYVSNPSNLNGVVGDTLYVNDADADWYYYMGQNYTYSANGQIPTTNKKDRYSESNLVETQVTYLGTDLMYQETGYVSLTERQSKYVYYKFYPVNDNATPTNPNDDYIMIELIGNPFTDRPDDLAFNGWVTTYENATIIYDKSYHESYVKVPVTYSNGYPSDININLSVSWTSATVGTMGSSWINAFANLKDAGMEPLTTEIRTYDYNYYMDDYYTQLTIARRTSRVGYYNDQGVLYTSGTCQSWMGCVVYQKMTNQLYNASTTYYQVIGGDMTVINHSTIPFPYTVEPIGIFEGTPIIAGFYLLEDIAYNGSLEGYYDSDGVALSGQCQSTICSYYRLIQYYNGGTAELYDNTKTYYYLVTRDTNIVRMTSNVTGSWGTEASKPFTLTSLHNGNRSNVIWNVSGTYVKCYSDTNIENIIISAGTSYTSTSDPSSGSTTSRFFYGNFYNVKLGRGITRNGTYANFLTVVGGANTTTTVGSSSNLKKYKLMVESGFYSSSGLSNTNNNGNATDGTLYLEMKAVYGNDYDRITQNNSNLNFYYCAGASWRGNHYSDSTTGIIFDLIVKSGNFGTNGNYSNMYYAGIYVGAQVGGDTYAAKRIKVEGGDIFNLIGGPLTNSSIRNYNDTYIYMTGGSVDMINGGAGIAATYGNKIIQVTGGIVNYSIYGGSNASMDLNTTNPNPGIVYGDSYVYVGGNAVVGDPNNLNDTLWGTTAGNVFGSGNGLSTSASRGANENAHIVVADNAHINRSIYGGGNYGATGGSFTSLATSNTEIVIIGGTIEGAIYGGGNNNGSGSEDTRSVVTIEMTGGNANGGIYGGSDITGIVYGPTNVNIYGGNVLDGVYGGGRGGPDGASDGTFVGEDTSVVIGSTANDYNSLPLNVNGTVYGGSAYGTVGNIESEEGTTAYVSSVTVNRGTVSTVFGGGKGGRVGTIDYTAYVEGSAHVEINGGTITDVYGGCDLLGTPKGTAIVDIKGGNTNTVYGGGNQASVPNTDVNLINGTVGTVYGGSNQAGGTSTDVKLGNGTTGSTVTTIFGGSKSSGTITTTNIITSNGSVGTIYGGNDQGTKSTTTNVTITGGTNNQTIIYGGGRNAPADTTNVNLNGGTIGTVYGGGEAADVTLKTNINLGNSTDGSNVTMIFGGSKSSGQVEETEIVATRGLVGTIYGGNDQGTSTGTTTITITGGTNDQTIIYGGGKNAPTNTTTVNLNGGTIGTVYGGGEAADVIGNPARTQATTVNLSGANVTTIFGGSNTLGDVLLSDVNIESGSVDTVYGGNNVAGSTANSDVDVTGGDIGIAVYGGGYQANTPVTSVTITNAGATIPSVFGGGHAANVSTSASVIVNGGNITNIYGGSDQSMTVNSSTIELTSINDSVINVGTIYGGNNAGGQTITTDIDINSGLIGDIYGGGDSATTTTATLDITGATISGSIYGGGRGANATITNNTNLTITNTTITGDVFGGGHAGAVSGTVTPQLPNAGNTTVNVSNSTIGGSVYGGCNQAVVTGNTTLNVLASSSVAGSVFGGGNAGIVEGNASTKISSSEILTNVYGGGNVAYVNGNTLLNIEGNTNITGNVFGSGNNAGTGTEYNNNAATSTVNIVGGIIGGDVYGGPRTSVVYGTALIRIGDNAVNNNTLTTANIDITGTVFGGGDAKPVGSDIWTFDHISVKNGVDVLIDGSDHTLFNIAGHLFGSGNASSIEKGSTLTIKNYGSNTLTNCKKNISIQRVDNLVIDNSCIELEGAADRTNTLEDRLYTLSRITHLKLKNNSTLYLQTITNMLASFTSAVDINNVEQLATITIDPDTGDYTRNVNNRLYAWEGENINISPEQMVDVVTGPVYGMTFFGRYNHDRNGYPASAFYSDEYANGEAVSSSELVYFVEGSYVKGLHKRMPDYDAEHDIEVDGFYTNEENEDIPGTIKTIYIQPGIEGDNEQHYCWSIGEQVSSFPVTLTASKYSTLGGQLLSLNGFNMNNTQFRIVGFNFNELDPAVSLVSEATIPRVAANSTIADNTMSLVMRTGQTGWFSVGSTTYLTDEDNPYTGTTFYQSDDSLATPGFQFYLYHSKNLSSDAPEDMGVVIISVETYTPINEIEYERQLVNVEVTLKRKLFTDNKYEAAITSGQQYELFMTNPTTVTSTSSISTYYSLYAESATSIYQNGYYRALTSNFVFPEKTKITMIDYANTSEPEYYYYVVDADDEVAAQTEFDNQGEVSYNLSSFIKMGSVEDNNTDFYDDAARNAIYYDSALDIAEEEFVFIVDFSESGIIDNHSDVYLLLELRRIVNNIVSPVIGVLDDIRRTMVFDLYSICGDVSCEAEIEVSSTINPATVYLGEVVNLKVDTVFAQRSLGGKTVYDTKYFNQKLGLKITLFDINNHQINGYDLMGVAFRYNGIDYYPRVDGSYRINIAPRIANVSANLSIKSINGNLATGTYTILIEAFGSPDGIYNGLVSAGSDTADITVINALYGLDASLIDSHKIIDKTTGFNQNEQNDIIFNFNYISSLANDNIRVSLYRRDYTSQYSTTYELVDLRDYVSNTLIPTANEKEYMVNNNPTQAFNMFMNMNPNLISGTYKFVFKLYASENYVGEVSEYVIIK